jgi:2-keto-4-pentenoate hydratase/2-oxohepta-3-ene-1,7-dioic acid hydratase in catechol pathway
MRLLRAGEPGRERPCAMAPDNSVHDLSAWVNDWSGSALDPAFLLDLEARFDREGRSLPLVDISQERIGPPVRPGQILAIGLNYRKHVEEAGLALPKEPLVASKSHWAVCGPCDDLMELGGDRTSCAIPA